MDIRKHHSNSDYDIEASVNLHQALVERINHLKVLITEGQAVMRIHLDIANTFHTEPSVDLAVEVGFMCALLRAAEAFTKGGNIPSSIQQFENSSELGELLNDRLLHFKGYLSSFKKSHLAVHENKLTNTLASSSFSSNHWSSGPHTMLNSRVNQHICSEEAQQASSDSSFLANDADSEFDNSSEENDAGSGSTTPRKLS